MNKQDSAFYEEVTCPHCQYVHREDENDGSRLDGTMECKKCKYHSSIVEHLR